jgi:hypothetical protein
MRVGVRSVLASGTMVASTTRISDDDKELLLMVIYFYVAQKKRQKAVFDACNLLNPLYL